MEIKIYDENKNLIKKYGWLSILDWGLYGLLLKMSELQNDNKRLYYMMFKHKNNITYYTITDKFLTSKSESEPISIIKETE